MSVAFVFPGQGSHFPGMLHSLMHHPAVDQTLDEVSKALDKDVRKLDTERCLEFGVSVQIALFTAGVATARSVEQQGIRPVAVAGLSVGAFAAAVIAGVMQLSDAVELIKLRAQEMGKLYPTGYGLSAVVGLTESEVTRIVESKTTPEAPIFVGNINAPRQIVIAGANVGMDKVLDEARLQGASEAVHLRVRLVALSAASTGSRSFEQAYFCYYFAGSRTDLRGECDWARLAHQEAIAGDLANNIAHGVRWHDATTVLEELGCNLFLEMPPGHVLSELAEQNLSGVHAIPVAADALPKILRLAQQEEANA